MTHRDNPMSEAEKIAIAALGKLAQDSQNLQRFLDLTGLSVDTLRASAQEPGFLASVLGYFINHEPDLLVLAEHLALPPDEIVRAHRQLSASASDGMAH